MRKYEHMSEEEQKTFSEWRKWAIEQEQTYNSRHMDMFAYMMARRFTEKQPNPDTRNTYAYGWLERIASGAHWARADEYTTRVLLEFVQVGTSIDINDVEVLK